MRQAALDGGTWETARLLLPYENILTPAPFAGTFGEMSAAVSFKDGMTTLKAGHDKRDPDTATSGEAAGGTTTARAKGKARAAREKEKEKKVAAAAAAAAQAETGHK